MGRLSIAEKIDSKGNTFWTLGQTRPTLDDDCLDLRCTYNENIEIVDYYLGYELVTQDSLIITLAGLYDNRQTYQDIMDHLQTEMGYKTFLKEHGREL